MSSNSLKLSPKPSNRPAPSFLLEIGIVFFLILATLIINLRMIRDGLNGNVDLKWHLTWLQHFSKQIAEGIWYPRWLAGTNYGYGSPTFIFYPPLVYYIGSLLKFSGLNAQDTMIALFSLALFLSGLNFYIYGRNRWGLIASFVGALAYMTTPYLALDIYYRGGLASMFAQAWIPLGWWLTEKALVQPRWRVGLALFWTIMALTHTPSLLLCIIIWFPCTLFFLLNKPWKAVVKTILSAGIGLGIASLYLLPAIIEQSFVNIETMKGVFGGYKSHLLRVESLIEYPFKLENISYIFLHQSLTIIVLTIIILIYFRHKEKIIQKTWPWLAVIFALVFFMSYLSVPIWQSSRTLQMVQFPWRLLQIYSFSGSALCGLVVSGILKLRWRKKIFLLSIIIGIIIINFNYSYKLSRKYISLRNPGRGKIEHLEHIKKILDDPYTNKLRDVKEYRPLLKNSLLSPPIPVMAQSRISLISGTAQIKINQWTSYKRKFNVKAEEDSTIRIRTYYYPAWHLYVNKKPHMIYMSDDGTMEVKLEAGAYEVELIYKWTQAFTMGIALSIFSLLSLILFWIKSPKTSVLPQQINGQ